VKKNLYEYPKSSFLAMDKDTSLIINKILSNDNVLKLLYYHTKDCLKEKKLTPEQKESLFENKQISNVPKVVINKNALSYIRITFDSFTPNATNPYYRDYIVEIKILCHFDDWNLDGFELRPYRIAGEIDSMLNGQHLTGIGDLNFMAAN
jgi:hypothetical protein